MTSQNSKIHESAIIDKGAKIGDGTNIWHFTHVAETGEIGENSNVGQNCFIAGIVGNGCKIQNNVNVYKGVKLGNYVFCGPSMTFTNDMNPRAKYPKHGNYIETIVEEGVSFGAHSTVIPGIKIGKWAFIGAGTVVTKDVPAYALVYGNPGKIKGWICECGEKLPEDFEETTCKVCDRKYIKNDQNVEQK